ncbi:MAG: hypothetical protein HC809_00500 [Gammaproteobacteria bacterium]|nr:hypothetical protein [Gammaproteobacteria bacterium]
MKQAKRQGLELKGWKVGSTHEFVGLSDEETAYIELKLALSDRLKGLLEKQGVTRMGLASH